MQVEMRGGGRPLILLHGWSSHGGYFAPQRELADRFRLVIPDLPGHRHSPSAADVLDIPTLARELRVLVEKERLDNAVLIGWSMGAMVAFEYLRAHGSAGIAGLVVEDMTPRILNDAGWQLGIRGGFDQAQSDQAVQAMRADWSAHGRASAARLFARGGPADPALLAWTETEIQRNDGEAMAALWRSMAEQDFRSLMPSLRLPVLIVHGGESQVYDPTVSAWLEHAIPDARRICLAHSGHAPHMEQPADFNAALARFADSL